MEQSRMSIAMGRKGHPTAARLARMTLIAGVLGAAVPSALALDHTGAERALMQGRVDEAVATLRSQSPIDGRAHLLLCRAFYAQAMEDEAISECEAALQTLNTSEAQDWMGRVYGMKANHAGPIAGFGLARKVKAAFEAAVQLDPASPEAANDLSEYYIAAPLVVGGGLDKAEDLATRVEHTLPQPAHRIRALIAEKRKDYPAAESEFRLAVGVAGHPDAWSDLGGFYYRRNQPAKGLDALKHCVAADPTHDASLVDAASILKENQREPALAEQWLRLYLEGNAHSDAAPVFKVHVELGELLAHDGDRAGAKIELSKAQALASQYAPARKAMQTQ
jgi:tetratricopeptide (TPR) repeat protein